MPIKLKAESKDYHTKAQTNLRLSEIGAAMLNTLAHHYGIGRSSVVEMLVRERIHEKHIKVDGHAATKRRKRG